MELQSGRFFDAREPIAKHRVHLPHWQQGNVLQFVTWNLGDSLPLSKRQQLMNERDLWLRIHPKPWSQETEQEYLKQFVMRWQKWLDQGCGDCHFKNPEISQLMKTVLFHFHQNRYELDSFVIMPNHVHVLFSPIAGFTVERILHSWKSYAAHEISTRWSVSTPFWMKDYWDRMIRDLDHYRRVRRYIRKNPEKASLRKGEYVLWMGDLVG